MPGRKYAAGSFYRYGFNGKENDNQVKGEGNQQDYGMRIYDPRLGKFLSVDPLSKKYPWYTPYQFTGNSPIKFIDLDGLEPAEPGTKAGQYEVADKKGTTDSYGWTWAIDKKTKKGNWAQRSSMKFTFGDAALNSKDDDLTKAYHSEASINLINPNRGDEFFPNPIDKQYFTFSQAFGLGVSLENKEKQGEAAMLLNNFVFGTGATLSFKPTSGMSQLLGNDPAFVKIAESFEQQALAYYNSKGTLEGFKGKQILQSLKLPYIKDTWFMHTVMGGTQQFDAQIKHISATEIKVNYVVWDHFGAGTDDAKSNLPGLPSLYWLQHNSSSVDPSVRQRFNPFIWNVRVNR